MHPCDICPRWDASVYYLPKDSQIRSSQPQGMAPDTGRGEGVGWLLLWQKPTSSLFFHPHRELHCNQFLRALFSPFLI